MAENVYSFIQELRKAQDEGRYTVCPRCGQPGSKGEVQSHACEALICKDCYKGEEKLIGMNVSITPTFWYVFKSGEAVENPYADSKAADIVDDIEHGGALTALLSIMKDWYTDPGAESNRAWYIYKAYNTCRGLDEVWFFKEPGRNSRARFKAKDTDVMLNFKYENDEVLWAINICGVFD